MHCLDTNIIIDFLRGDEVIVRRVNDLIKTENVYLTPITLCELFKGVYLSSKVNEELVILKDFLSFFSVLDFDVEACNEFGKEYARLKKKGKTTNEFDLMIACIASVNNLTLVTRDKKHFRKLGVRVEVW